MYEDYRSIRSTSVPNSQRLEDAGHSAKRLGAHPSPSRERGSPKRYRFDAATVVLLFGLAWACGGQTAEQEIGLVNGTLSGVVFKGLLDGGRVVVKAMGDGSWNETVAEAKTDVAGSFEIEVGLARGNLLIEVTGGSYVEESTGETVDLGTRKLYAWVPSFEVGDSRSSIQVNPVTTLIVAYTRWRMRDLDEDYILAERRASSLMEEHFGDAEWRDTLPVNPTDRSDLPLRDSSVMGILIAGLSWMTHEMAEAGEISAMRVNSSSLIELLIEDIEADGKFNGIGRNGRRLTLFEQDLDDQTLRLQYALSILQFLESSRNTSGLSRSDLEDYLFSIATRDSVLFDTDPLGWHLDPPEIVIERPTPGSAVRGVVEVEVYATDAQAVTDFGFSEPSQLQANDPVGRGQPRATIRATLDTSLFSDGPLTIGLFAENDRGLRYEKSFEVIVSNKTPIVTIVSPEPDQAVRGIQDIVAFADVNLSTGARITSVYAASPPDLEDTSGIANRLEASWDTTAEPEGSFTLEIRAVDELGAEGFARVTVEVANREPVEIFGRALLAGRPIRQATVAALALERPSTAVGGYEHLGNTKTENDGSFTVTIQDRNYDGPLAIRVGAGGSWQSPVFEYGFSTSAERDLSTYLPSPDYLHQGGRQEHELIIGAWTTLADHLARYHSLLVQNPYSPVHAWERAEEMISGHFVRLGYPCLHTTRTRDLTEEAVSLQDALLSLGDVGLIWMLGDQQNVSAMDLVSALASDISTGIFNGNDGSLAIPAVGDVVIDVDTTRCAMAMAIHEFADSEFNASGITQSALLAFPAGGQSFLDALCTDSRAIYGRPGTPFDNKGPIIHWLSPGIDEVFGNETVTVSATADDDTGIATFMAFEPLDKDELLLDRISDADRLNVEIANTVPPNSDNYFVRVGLHAVDTLGYETISHRFFSRRAPEATIAPILRFHGNSWFPIDGPVRGIIKMEAAAIEGFATEDFSMLSPDPSHAAITTLSYANDQSLRVEIDTALGIDDGPLGFEVCHRTIDGRQACDQASIIIDNTPPVLVMSSGAPMHGGSYWVGCELPTADCGTAPVFVDYSVFDATSGVAELRLSGSGFLPGSGPIAPFEDLETFGPAGCISAECEGTFRVDLPAGYYTMRLSAIDAAGNSVESPEMSFTVDTHVPRIADHSGVFDNENLMDFRKVGESFVYEPREGHVAFSVSDALVGTVRWNRMEHRLSAQTVADARSNNVPVIEIAAWEVGEPATGAGDLVVEYLYGWAISEGSFSYGPAGWRQMPTASAGSSASATHSLPLSLELLGGELAEFPRHKVQVRVLDKAGNGSTLVYDFRLDLIPAPVAIEVDESYPQAADPESIYAYSFEQVNLPELFGGRAFEDDHVRIARAFIHQPHPGIQVRLLADYSDTITTQRVRNQSVVDLGTRFHTCWECEGPDIFNCGCMLLVVPDSANDDPPCVDNWNSEDRRHKYKVYSETDGVCFDDRTDPIPGEAEIFTEEQVAGGDVVVFDPIGSRLQPQSDGTFIIGQGTYVAFIRMPLPEGFMTSTYDTAQTTVFGEVLQNRRVFDSDHNTRMVQERQGSVCVNLFHCWNYFTRLEDLVLYESGVSWLGVRDEGGERRVEMNILTGSTNPLVTELRDPYTGGEASNDGIPETYRVQYETISEDRL